jgi:hypothetical protein
LISLCKIIKLKKYCGDIEDGGLLAGGYDEILRGDLWDE